MKKIANKYDFLKGYSGKQNLRAVPFKKEEKNEGGCHSDPMGVIR